MLAQLCPALCDPMNCSPPGKNRISQARILEWLLFPPRGHLPDAGTGPTCAVSPASRGGSLLLSHRGSSWCCLTLFLGHRTLLPTTWPRVDSVSVTGLLGGLVVRMLSAYGKKFPSWRCRPFRSLAKVSSKTVGDCLSTRVGQSSGIALSVLCLGLVTQKQKFL